ncbi:MAG TPA: nuclear transport factor 2 family protein [Gemmatimonadales bacterium]|nr:nuclear transport factor 2 family protein [Gemmatimonadales bacterium]
MFDVAEWLRAWGEADADLVLAFYTPDCRYRDPATVTPLIGLDALRSHLLKVFAYWPEQRWEEVRRWEHADHQGLTLLWRAEITSPRSGRSVVFEGLDVLRFAGGRIAEQLIFFDPAAWRSLAPGGTE